MTDDPHLTPTARLHNAVHDLIDPRKVPLLRQAVNETLTLTETELEMATSPRGAMPSLWDQMSEAVSTSNEQTSRSVPGSRPPIDLDLREIQRQIIEQVLMELRHYKAKPHQRTFMRVTRWLDHGEWVELDPDSDEPRVWREPEWCETSREVTELDLPASLRLLQVHVGNDVEDHVMWWAYRLEQWARVARKALGAIVLPQPRRIRDTQCPECQAKHVTLLSLDGEPKLMPALLIDMQDGMVRAAECSVCGASWFRGQELWDLADRIPPRQRLHSDTPQLEGDVA